MQQNHSTDILIYSSRGTNDGKRQLLPVTKIFGASHMRILYRLLRDSAYSSVDSVGFQNSKNRQVLLGLSRKSLRMS